MLLSTPRETLRADHAFYDGIGEEVILRENVRAKNGHYRSFFYNDDDKEVKYLKMLQVFSSRSKMQEHLFLDK